MDISGILSDQNPWWGDPRAGAARLYPIRRYLFGAVYDQVTRLDDRRAVVILGLRQVGKTVLLHQVVDKLLEDGWPSQNITYFDFDDDRLTAEVSPRQIVETRSSGIVESHPRAFLFDEIHRAPGWGAWLRRAVDAGRDRYVVTDSAATVLRESARESGLGRWDEYRMEGLSFGEFLRLHAGPDEETDDVLRRLPNPPPQYFLNGGFPEHRNNDNLDQVRQRLRTDIVDRAILRDLIRSEVDVQRVKDLFVYLIQDSGAIWDVAARSRDLQEADHRSVRKWVRLLEDTMLIIPLERRSGSATSRLRSRARYYAADHGLIVAFSPVPNPHLDENVRGQVFEALVFRHLREVAQESGGTIHYWREKESREIDFLYEGPRGTVAIEVAASSSPRSGKITRLRDAGRGLEARRAVMIYGGAVRDTRHEVPLIPMQDFLLAPQAVLDED